MNFFRRGKAEGRPVEDSVTMDTQTPPTSMFGGLQSVGEDARSESSSLSGRATPSAGGLFSGLQSQSVSPSPKPVIHQAAAVTSELNVTTVDTRFMFGEDGDAIQSQPDTQDPAPSSSAFGLNFAGSIPEMVPASPQGPSAFSFVTSSDPSPSSPSSSPAFGFIASSAETTRRDSGSSVTSGNPFGLSTTSPSSSPALSTKGSLFHSSGNTPAVVTDKKGVLDLITKQGKSGGTATASRITPHSVAPRKKKTTGFRPGRTDTDSGNNSTTSGHNSPSNASPLSADQQLAALAAETASRNESPPAFTPPQPPQQAPDRSRVPSIGSDSGLSAFHFVNPEEQTHPSPIIKPRTVRASSGSRDGSGSQGPHYTPTPPGEVVDPTSDSGNPEAPPTLETEHLSEEVPKAHAPHVTVTDVTVRGERTISVESVGTGDHPASPPPVPPKAPKPSNCSPPPLPRCPSPAMALSPEAAAGRELERVQQERQDSLAALLTARKQLAEKAKAIEVCKNEVAALEQSLAKAAEQEEFERAEEIQAELEEAGGRAAATNAERQVVEASITELEESLQMFASLEMKACSDLATALAKALKTKQDEVTRLTAEHESAETTLVDSLRLEEERLASVLAACESESESVEQERDRLATQMAEETATVTQQLEALHNQGDAVRARIAELLRQLEKEREAEAELAKQTETLRRDKKRITSRFEPREGNLTRRAEQNLLARESAEIAQRSLETQRRELEAQKQIWATETATRAAEVSKLKAKEADVSNLLASIQRRFEKDSELHQELSQALAAMKTADAEYVTLLAKHTQVKAQHANAESEVVGLRSSLVEVRRQLKGLTERQTDLEELKRVAVKERNFKDAARVQAEVKALKDEFEALTEDIAQKEESLDSSSAEAAEVAERASQIEDEVMSALGVLHEARRAHLTLTVRRTRRELRAAVGSGDYATADVLQSELDAVCDELRSVCELLGYDEQLPPESESERSDEEEGEQIDTPVDRISTVSSKEEDGDSHEITPNGTPNGTVEGAEQPAADIGAGGTGETTDETAEEVEEDVAETLSPTQESPVAVGEDEAVEKAGSLDADNLQREIEELEADLEKAVDEERFEDADVLNSQIQAKQELLSISTAK